ncbi:hypothetical protein BJ508DRAFT_359908 [Ascobolus immersus RN42]|uniref:Uncharacterized protein n=1 Tax=Ascobolus immersus RN42 TaxID=1160509 RepID=A0A3N4IHQ1_ASCIM|nr:hypothetical protein BJ508DRAFT_359908 [Ascobolus immersus RN42]
MPIPKLPAASATSAPPSYSISDSYGPLPPMREDSKFVMSTRGVGKVPSEDHEKNKITALLFTRSQTIANPRFVRTYHPALRHCRSVSLATFEHDSTPFWVVYGRDPHGHLYAGELEIHVYPEVEAVRHIDGIHGGDDPWDYLVDPFGFLSGMAISKLACLFPAACGVRLLRSGALTVVFPRWWDLWELNAITTPHEFGGLSLAFEVKDGNRKYEVTRPPKDGDMGFRFRMRDGKEGCLVATHSFVKLSKPWLSKNWFGSIVADKAEKVVGRLAGALRSKHVSSMPSSETLLVGTAVRTASGKQTATVTHTFDRPSSGHFSFPNSFLHDLSIVSPVSTSPPTSQIPTLAFASLSELTTPEPSLFDTGSSTPALLAGTEYHLNPQTRTVSVALLWRTAADGVDGELQSQRGMLCLKSSTGNAKDSKLVCFESAKVWMKMDDGGRGKTSFRMGFLLPEVIREMNV